MDGSYTATTEEGLDLEDFESQVGLGGDSLGFWPMRSPLLILLALGCITPAEESEWVTIFDGKTLTGWRAASEANWRVEDGAIVVDDGERGLLVHQDRYENYELIVEFKAASGTNSGVFLSTKEMPAKVTEDCYELNIAPPDNPFPTGSLVGRKKYGDAGEKSAWRKFEVRVEGKRVIVKLDGAEVMDYTADKPAGGTLIGLQKNEGRVAFRNIRVRKLP